MPPVMLPYESVLRSGINHDIEGSAQVLLKFIASGWRLAADPSRLARGQCAGGPTPGVAPSPDRRIREHGWLRVDRARSGQHRTTRTIPVVQVAPGPRQ